MIIMKFDRFPYGPGRAGALRRAVEGLRSERSHSSSPGCRTTASIESNTLFVFTVEEGDHFVGSAPTDPSCDGVTTPCVYPE